VISSVVETKTMGTDYLLKLKATSFARAQGLASRAQGLAADAIKQAKKDGDRQCPADLSSEIHSRIDEAVKKAHQTLKCRHYSLFDIRISEDGWPYILEACLFCSFSPLSVIPAMAAQSGREDLRHPNFFHSILERTMKEHASTNNMADDVSTACSDEQSTNSI